MTRPQMNHHQELRRVALRMTAQIMELEPCDAKMVIRFMQQLVDDYLNAPLGLPIKKVDGDELIVEFQRVAANLAKERQQ